MDDDDRDDDTARPSSLTIAQTFTRADASAVQVFMYWHSRPHRTLWAAVLVFALCVIVGGYGFWVTLGSLNDTFDITVTTIVFIVISSVRQVRQGIKAIVSKGETTVTLSGEGVFAIQRDAHATHESTYAWEAFDRFVEQPAFFLLVMPTRLVIPIIKRFLDEDEVEDVFALLSDHLPENDCALLGRDGDEKGVVP